MYQKGQQALEYYSSIEPKPKILEKSWAIKITHSISQWASDNRKSFSNKDFCYIVDGIIDIFDCEEKV